MNMLMQKFKGLAFGRAFLIGLFIAGAYLSIYYDSGSALESQISGVSSEITKSKNEIESVKKAITDAERYQKTMSNRETEMQKVLRAIPEKLEASDLMRTISLEAKGVGAEINGLVSRASSRSSSAQSNDKSKSFYEEIPIDIDLTGTYNQIMLFLSNMTRLDKVVTANKMTFTLASKGRTSAASAVSPNINLKATLQAYRYLPEEKSTKSAKGAGGGAASPDGGGGGD